MIARVLIVDDSAVVRRILSQILGRDPEIQVVGVAPDPFVARDMIIELKPNVLTLDVEMPRMNGITFLQKLMARFPIPTVVLSSLTPKGSAACLAALDAGAVDVIAKPGGAHTLADVSDDLAFKVKQAAQTKLRVLPAPNPEPKQKPPPLARVAGTHQVIGIGASTGGTRALECLLPRMPANSPGMAVVQHMPAGFTQAFAQHLDELCSMHVKEATSGDVLRPGQVLLAPGNYHMVVERFGSQYRVQIRSGPRVSYNRPSVDVLFRSLAVSAGRNAIGVILTGMGSDGARGLRMMRDAGAATLAQDETSSVVYGMPKAAVDQEAVEEALPLDHIDGALRKIFTTERAS